jgi:hypothetical protein
LTSETLVKSEKHLTKDYSQKKQSATKSATENKISVCDIMKNNTSKVIKKMESQIPTYIQNYSDLYTTYLHAIDDIFGTCYISEKQFFDKLGIDQKTLRTLEKSSNTLANVCSTQIDASTNFLRTYVQFRTSAIESYDRYTHLVMDYYANVLSQFNSALEKQ